MSETRSVEITGSSIEEAIEAGLEQLQVSRENVIVEILEEPSRGFLGVGSKQALVRLTTAARPRPEETEAETSPSPPSVLPHAPRAPRPERHERRERPERSSRYEKPRYERASEPVEHQELDIEVPKASPVEEDAIPEEVKLGRDKLRELLRFMGCEAVIKVEKSVSTEEEGEVYVLQVNGNEVSSLIGHKGETIVALQYLTRLLASRGTQTKMNFIVDVDGYKANRAEKLFRLAHRMANQAVERKRTVKLEPMPPHERRIIHMALRDRKDVTTTSVGEGRFRKVTIIPSGGR